MKSLKLAAFYLLHWTWALSQNIVGGAGCLLMSLSGKHRRENFHGAVVTYVDTKKNFGGVSLGMFIFLNGRHSKENPGDGWTHDSRIHEFGHCVQSILLGPLYWVVVGLPSITWCSFPPLAKMHNTKATKHIYYKLYCEGWANLWGAAWTGEDFVTPEMLRGARYGKPWKK
ncbi:MAG: hypothetical protein LBB75_02460 [Oscillospiraceae bacterium]|jgi:hypothetical protein|nr:hypothetical protein [Oscillospiraceae bacterium]